MTAQTISSFLRRAPALVCLLPLLLYAQPGSFEDRLRRQEQAFGQRLEAQETTFASRLAALEQNWEQHLAAVREHWQDGRVSSREEYVHYGPGYNSRLRLRLDEGGSEQAGLRAEVQVAADSPDPGSTARDAYRQLVEEARAAGLEPARDLDDGRGGTLSEPGLDSVAEASIEQQPGRREHDASGREVIVYQVEIPLVPDHIEKRAGRWREQVRAQAKRWELPADLIFAVIHTESWYNPMARSHVPAFGMMQLVPRYGGAEAHQMLTGREGEPTPEVLYQGERNIELGSAYLHKLRYTYYKDVLDDRKAELLITCAYNTGPGNVNRALTSKGGATRNTSGKHKGFKKPRDASSSFDRAIPVINRLGVEELEAKLLEDLPWEETVGYLEKVSRRRALYLAWSR